MIIRVIFCLIALLINLGIWVHAEDFCNVKYIKNYDGDTYTFDLGETLPDFFRYVPVRLYGIDTPEMKVAVQREAATKARDFAGSEIKNAQQVNLINCKKDKYFRILCKIEYDGKDLTEELLKRKMGYPYYGGTKKPFN